MADCEWDLVNVVTCKEDEEAMEWLYELMSHFRSMGDDKATRILAVLERMKNMHRSMHVQIHIIEINSQKLMEGYDLLKNLMQGKMLGEPLSSHRRRH